MTAPTAPATLDTSSILGTPTELRRLADYLNQRFTAIRHEFFPAAQELFRLAELAELAIERLQATGGTASPGFARFEADIKDAASRSVGLTNALRALHSAMLAHESVVCDVAYWVENSLEKIEVADRPRAQDAGERLREMDWMADDMARELEEAIKCHDRIGAARDALMALQRQGAQQ